MKGVIFDLLQQTVSEAHGEDTWDALLDAAGLEGAYTAVGSYPDEEFLSLVKAGSAKLGVETDQLERWFGARCIPILAGRYPVFFEPHTSTRTFLLTLNEVIHPEVRKLFPGAYAPSFDFREEEGSVSLGYFSHRDLCSFAEGLIEGAATHFGEQVWIDQPSCTRRGDERCMIRVSFSGPSR